MELHLISSGMQEKEELTDTLIKVHPYADYIHLRERNWRATDFLEVIATLIEAGVPGNKLIINDRVDIAHIMGTGGIQLGTHSLPALEVKRHYGNMRVGCSVHSAAEAKEKEKAGADYVLFGHVFPTASKRGLAPRGLPAVRKVVDSVNIPVIAIGGIKPENVQQMKESGVKGVAVLSGILLADNPPEAAAAYHQALKKEVAK